jgi:hypothetical protein
MNMLRIEETHYQYQYHHKTRKWLREKRLTPPIQIIIFVYLSVFTVYGDLEWIYRIKHLHKVHLSEMGFGTGTSYDS